MNRSLRFLFVVFAFYLVFMTTFPSGKTVKEALESPASTCQVVCYPRNHQWNVSASNDGGTNLTNTNKWLVMTISDSKGILLVDEQKVAHHTMDNRKIC